MKTFFLRHIELGRFIVWWLPLFVVVSFFTPVEGPLDFQPEGARPIPLLETSYLYLLLLVGSILFPFLLSFDKNVHFWKKWKPLFLSNGIVAFFFIAWDILFTARGVWGFNENYHLSAKVAGLPLEEWMWFFIIPYCCIFIYECLNFYVKKDPLLSLEKWISRILIVFFVLVGIAHWGHTYTMLTFFSAALITIYHIRYRPSKERSRFLGAWLVSLIPFYLVNGVLTGAYTQAPIVVYSKTEFLGIRWGTIPLDDAVYLYVFLLWIVFLYEIFREHNSKSD